MQSQVRRSRSTRLPISRHIQMLLLDTKERPSIFFCGTALVFSPLKYNLEMVLPATLDPNSPLDNTIGALYIGTFASSILHGVCLLQAFLYFQTYKQDAWYIKAAVIISVLFDAVHLFLIAAGVYFYAITNYHDPNNLQNVFRPGIIEAIFIGGNGCVVQVFYTYRIWRLSKRNYLLASFILLLICGEFATGFAWAISAVQMKTFSGVLRVQSLGIATNVFSCSVDILIAGTLCILLHRARTGFKRVDSIINKLIVFVISTGLLTSIFAVLVFILVCTLRTFSRIHSLNSSLAAGSLIYAGVYLCVSPLYTNSFLSTLNSRSTIGKHTNDERLEMSNLTPQGTNLARINIRIETTKEAVQDIEQASNELTPRKDTMDSDKDFLPQKGHV